MVGHQRVCGYLLDGWLALRRMRRVGALEGLRLSGPEECGGLAMSVAVVGVGCGCWLWDVDRVQEGTRATLHSMVVMVIIGRGS